MLAQRLPGPLRRALSGVRYAGRFTWELLQEFMADDCPRMAAALSYYSVFAMPAMLGILTLVAGRVIPPDQLHQVLARQLTALVGYDSAARIVDIVENAVRPEFGGPLAIVGVVALLFAATASFASLQGALNAAWGVRPDPRRSDITTFLIKRLVSLVMIVSLGVLVMVSSIASGVLVTVQGYFSEFAPTWLRSPVVRVVDLTLSFALISLLVALIFRLVPDAVVRWRDALAGGAFTGALFTVGKVLIGYYLTSRDLDSVYGAAGSLAVALLWIYYIAMIFLLGAEFTQLWASRHNEPLVPEKGAVAVKRQVVYAEGAEAGQEVAE
ncbi:MAG: YihY/virulence factor BrkB family protein [Gemmatimonadota bacterium]